MKLLLSVLLILPITAWAQTCPAGYIANGGSCIIGIAPTVAQSAVLYTGTYTSGITATGTTGKTCILGSLNGAGTGGAATVALTSTNTIAGSTALVITAAGSGYTSSPTSATATSGTATCSGTATIATTVSIPDPGGLIAYLFNPAAALTFPLPPGLPGMQRCYRNATGGTGAITVAVAASNTIDLAGSNGTSGTGTLVSGGAGGDNVCLFSDAANHWYASVQKGTWTNN